MKLFLMCSLICFCLCSCATNQTGTGQSDTRIASPKKTVYFYAGVEKLKVYPAPDYKKTPIFRMSLNEKVVILKTHKDWAYCKVTATGRQGWVSKAYLESKPVFAEKSEDPGTTAVITTKQQSPPEHRSEKSGKPDPLDLLKPRSAEAASTGDTQKTRKKKVDADLLNPF